MVNLNFLPLYLIDQLGERPGQRLSIDLKALLGGELEFHAFELLDLLDAQSDLSVAREELIVTTFENTSASIGSLRIQNILLEYLIGEYDLPGALNR